MKNKRFIFYGVIVLLVVCGYYGTVAYRAYKRYEEIRKDDVSFYTTFSPIVMKDGDHEALRVIEKTWDLRYEAPMEDEVKIMGLVGYADDLNGLMQLWTDQMPPFSYVDMKRNKLWATRATVRSAVFPMRMQYHYTDLVLFASNEKCADVYKYADGVITHSVYSPPKEIEQVGAGEPATAPQLESSRNNNPNPESKPRPQ